MHSLFPGFSVLLCIPWRGKPHRLLPQERKPHRLLPLEREASPAPTSGEGSLINRLPSLNLAHYPGEGNLIHRLPSLNLGERCFSPKLPSPKLHLGERSFLPKLPSPILHTQEREASSTGCHFLISPKREKLPQASTSYLADPGEGNFGTRLNVQHKPVLEEEGRARAAQSALCHDGYPISQDIRFIPAVKKLLLNQPMKHICVMVSPQANRNTRRYAL